MIFSPRIQEVMFNLYLVPISSSEAIINTPEFSTRIFYPISDHVLFKPFFDAKNVNYFDIIPSVF